jgi:multidrug transporter EmrE-like cation transporter/adenylate kinase family enzyme
VKRLQRIGRVPSRPPRRLVVLISGPIRAGKTTFAERLRPKLHADPVRTKNILIDEYGAHPDVRLRQRLQALGEKLDVETDGRWVAAATRRRMGHMGPRTPIIVDSVRIPRQVEHLRELADVRIGHVHLNAKLKTLEARYAATAAADDPSYSEVRRNPTEARIDQMRKLTRIRFNTTYLRPRLVTAAFMFVIFMLTMAAHTRHLARAFALGAAFATVLTAPIAWFWFSHLERAPALVISAGTLLFFAILSGSALTPSSPIERDAQEPFRDSPAAPAAELATPPAGPEVVRARALTSSSAG